MAVELLGVGRRQMVDRMVLEFGDVVGKTRAYRLDARPEFQLFIVEASRKRAMRRDKPPRIYGRIQARINGAAAGPRTSLRHCH